MAELLDRIHAEIRARLEASRPAVDEYRMLDAALARRQRQRTGARQPTSAVSSGAEAHGPAPLVTPGGEARATGRQPGGGAADTW